MITLIAKYWKVILDAILIVAVIVLVFIWNPFNVFGKGLEFKPTTNLVVEIRQIGQLVTAQYYGEVVASIGEARLNLLQEDKLGGRGDFFYKKLKQDIFDAYQNQVLIPVEEAKARNKRNKAERQGRKKALAEIEENYGREYISGDFQSFISDTLDIVLLFAVENEIHEPVSENLKQFKKEKKREKFRAKRLENLYDEIARKYAALNENDFAEYLGQGFESPGFSGFYYNITEEEIKRKEQLAMIGRGSVKAGFDFSHLSERNIRFDESKHTLHIFGLQPTILNYDINPWFIPQRAVPGYDIVQAGRQANFLDAVKVKSYCKDKLKASALEAGILEEAQRYGEEVIKTFFTLVMDQEIHHIRFHDDLEEIYFEQIGHDSIIDHTELAFIKMIENEYLQKIDTTERAVLKDAYETQLQSLFYKLRQLSIRMKDSTEIPFNHFSYQLFDIISDSLISKKDYKKITVDMRWQIDDSTFAPAHTDTLLKHWFVNKSNVYDPFQFIYDYNEMLSSLEGRNTLLQKNDTLAFTIDTLIYMINPTLHFTDSISKADTLNLSQLNFPKSGLSIAQSRDIRQYKQYLKNQQQYYADKLWVYKLRDKVSTRVDLKKWQEGFGEKVGVDN